MPMQTPLHIETERQAGRAIIKIGGSATMEVCGQLDQCLSELIRTPVQMVVLDLADLDFICSDGLGVFVRAYHQCRQLGAAMRLARPTEPIRKLLDLTRLGKLLPVFPSVEEALRR